MPQPISIRRRLMRMMLLTTGLVLSFTCAAFFTYELLTFRQTMVRQLDTLAQAIASNSTTALAFSNPEDAQAVLAAFKADPHIVAAALYDASGAVFAVYPSTEATSLLPAKLATDGYRFEDYHLIGYEPVTEGDKRLGTLFVKSDMKAIGQRFGLYGLIAAIVVVLSAVLAYLVSHWQQARISQPILNLAETARAVSDRHDYSVRAADGSDTHEIDLLTGAFNHMLTQIQHSDSRLHAQMGRLSLLQQITVAIGERQDLRSIFQVALSSVEENLPIDFGCVCLYDSAAATMTVHAVGAASQSSSGALGLAERDVVAVDGNGLSRSIRGQLVYEPDVREVPYPFPQRIAAGSLCSLVIAPLIVEKQVFGAFIAARREPHSFTSGECEFLHQLSQHVALASHQAQLHSALQHAYDDLRQSQHTVMQQERLRALGQMASGIAHDINNAISPIALYTESMLEREPNLSERARASLTTIQRAIDDVAGTVARMREFYRPREPQLALAVVDLNRIVEQVIEFTRAKWYDLPQQRGVAVELRTEFAPDLPAIMGAEGEIRDALTNLIFNAVDAMPEGGTLSLRTRVEPGAAGLQLVRIEIADTGIGMDEETRRRCLEPFFTTKGERGTGLGLPMVYGMIQRHSAEMDVASNPGQGTTISLTFPAYTQVMLETTRFPAHQVMAKRLRVLVIDDDPLVIKAMEDALTGDGHAITSAYGGEAGIDAFVKAQGTAEPFAVVFTDLGMPRVDGRKVADAVKRASPRTPVVLLTGWGQRMIEENEIPPHVDRVLAKPPRLLELRIALRELTA
jgi:signal transduction histidine kinase/ActR/RegA family two-component response regulator